jgi:hypothetical protein
LPERDAQALSLARRIAGAYAAYPEVSAVALAGSLGAGRSDARSDVDLYVYASPPLSLDQRAAVASAGSSRREVGNAFWEPGDEWIDAASGLTVDAMFRSPQWIEDDLSRVLDRCEAWVGYSTCFWHNVLRSEVLFDRTGWYGTLQSEVRVPYPDALKRAIVAKNQPLLRSTLSSYAKQLASAEARGDAVSLLHRSAAFLASYFDVLFALNETPHPGEKRLVALAAELPRCPPALAADVRLLAAAVAAGGPTRPAVDALCDGLDALLARG